MPPASAPPPLRLKARFAPKPRQRCDGLGQAVEEGQLAKATDPEQIAFEIFGIALVVHHHRRLLGYKKARERALIALDSLLKRYSDL